MKYIILLLFTISAHFASARFSGSLPCDEAQAIAAARKFIALSPRPQDAKDIELQTIDAVSATFDSKHNQIIEYEIIWQYRSGPMLYKNFAVKVILSSASVEETGICTLVSASHQIEMK